MTENLLLKIEQDKAILDFKNTCGQPIWMFMRRIVMHGVLAPKLLNSHAVNTTRKNGLKAIGYLIRAQAHNFQFNLKNKHADFMLYVVSRGQWKKGRYFNQYSDDIVSVFGNRCITIEHPPISWEWQEPRINDNVIYNAPQFAWASKFFKISSEDYLRIEALIDFVQNRAKELYNIDISISDRALIRNQTALEESRMNSHARWVLKQIQKSGAKMLIMMPLSLSWYYPLNELLKKNNVVTADIQHGYITSTNTGYNYSEELLESPEVKIATPDYLLTYGAWWSTQTNLPYKEIIPIGNPYRTSVVSKIKRSTALKKLVLLGCGADTERYLDLAEYLFRQGLELEIVFRPHPSERIYTQQLLSNRKVLYSIDFNRELYSLLGEAELVVSEISTTLFEAIGIVPRIVVWRTAQSKFILPDCPFEMFETQEDLVRIIKNHYFVSVDEKSIWIDKWENNLGEFLNATIDNQKE